MSATNGKPTIGRMGDGSPRSEIALYVAEVEALKQLDERARSLRESIAKRREKLETLAVAGRPRYVLVEYDLDEYRIVTISDSYGYRSVSVHETTWPHRLSWPEPAPHVHTRECYDDAGPGRGGVSLICGMDSQPDVEVPELHQLPSNALPDTTEAREIAGETAARRLYEATLRRQPTDSEIAEAAFEAASEAVFAPPDDWGDNDRIELGPLAPSDVVAALSPLPNLDSLDIE